ncbi:hypothetical protein ACFRFH_16565 [Leifsonia sp. NPDC056824]|uniref:hypothetical protein n=1 Tax=Leifsonia sp. NPDC056824 TaxID=3345953 RepID=UPI0036BB9C1F
MKRTPIRTFTLLSATVLLVLSGCARPTFEGKVGGQILREFNNFADEIRRNAAEAYAKGIPLTEDYLRDKRPITVILDLTQAAPEALSSTDAVSSGSVLYAVATDEKGQTGTSSFYTDAGTNLNGFAHAEAHLFACADITVTYEAKPRTTMANGACPAPMQQTILSQQYSLINAVTGEVEQRPPRR